VTHVAGAEHDPRRAGMVERQLRRRGISDERVLAAMARVPREAFVPPELAGVAYDDAALPIGEAQDDLATLHRGDDVRAARARRQPSTSLDVGTGLAATPRPSSTSSRGSVVLDRADSRARRASAAARSS
jgi:protein-L-isoaspartate(D-aspartate) O-methyltransferase